MRANAWRALALLALGLAPAAQAQDVPDVDYPRLPAQGAAIDAFVPAGWALEQRDEGDLDKDGRADVVMVLRMLSPANVIANDGLGADRFDTNPRMLVVLFAGEGGYRLVLQDHALIPRPDNPVMDDYLDGDDAVTVRRGAFTVSLRSWASAGSWYTSATTFTFRHQDGCFRLIGYDQAWLHRATGETGSTSLNFAAGKGVFEQGTMESDAPLASKTVTIPPRPLPCLQDIGNGFEFDPGVPSPF